VYFTVFLYHECVGLFTFAPVVSWFLFYIDFCLSGTCACIALLWFSFYVHVSRFGHTAYYDVGQVLYYTMWTRVHILCCPCSFQMLGSPLSLLPLLF